LTEHNITLFELAATSLFLGSPVTLVVWSVWVFASKCWTACSWGKISLFAFLGVVATLILSIIAWLGLSRFYSPFPEKYFMIAGFIHSPTVVCSLFVACTMLVYLRVAHPKLQQ
jgi:hypothetical protein